MTKFLRFRLDVDDQGWPPAGAESLPVDEVGAGFRILVSPFFIKGISVGDIVECSYDSEGYVQTWAHTYKSRRSTIWVTPKIPYKWQSAKAALLALGCNVETLKQFGICSIDLPPEISLSTFDDLLKPIVAAGGALAYPSLRHEEKA